MNLDDAAHSIIELARFCAPSHHDSIVRHLRGERSNPIPLAISQELEKVLRNLSRDLDQEALELAFRVASLCQREENDRIDLCWSGPKPDRSPIRRIEQVVIDMFESAEEIVTMSLFASYGVSPIRRAVDRALARGVHFRVLTETVLDSEGQVSHDPLTNLGLDSSQQIEILEWPASERPRNSGGRPAKIHAKFLLQDRSRLLVTSANLTDDAMERNLEVGVATSNPQTCATWVEYVEELIAKGKIRRRV